MALEYGINFNTEAGRKKAEDEIKAWRKDMQSYFDKHKLKIGIGGKDSSTKTATTQLQGYRKELQELRNEYRKLSTAELANGGGASVIDRYRKLREQVGIYGGTLDQAVKSEDKMRAAAEKTTPVVNRQTQAYKRQSDAMNQLKSYAMNFLSVYAGIRMIKNLATITGEFEMQKVSMQAILQDAEKGAAIFERIKELAVISPFQFKDLVSYTKQLSAFSIPYEDLYDTTKMLADLSAGLGVGMDRLILAYGQVRSAAVLRGQELRQFTEAGIPIVEELRQKLSEANGELVTTGEVFEYISARKVPFEMVRDIMVEMTSEGGKFYKMQEVQAETLKGKISNLTDAFQIMMANIGESDGGLMKGAIDGTRGLIENYEEVGKVLARMAVTYGAVRIAIFASIAAMNAEKANRILLTTITAAQSRAQSILNATILKNPYAAAALAVSALATGLWAAYRGYYTFNNEVRKGNKIIDDTNIELAKERALLGYLYDKLETLDKGTEEYKATKESIISQFGKYKSNLDVEMESVDGLTTSYNHLSDAIYKAYVTKAHEDLISSAAESYSKTRSKAESKILKELTRKYGDGAYNVFADIQAYIESGELTDRVERVIKDFDSILISAQGTAGQVTATGSNEIERQISVIKRATEIYGEVTDALDKTFEARNKAAEANTPPIVNELADWQKTVDSFVEANDASFLEYSGEDGTAFSYISRIRDEYKNLTDQYSTYSTLVDSGSKKQAQRLKEQIDLTEQLAKTMGFSLGADGKTSSGGKDPNIEQNAMIKAAERLSELRAKMALEEKKYALEVRQADIESTKEGAAYKIAMMELERDKELLSIEERKQAMVNANRDIARAKWESEGKSGVFSSDVQLTKEQEELIPALRKGANDKYLADDKAVREKIVSRYRDYGLQKLAIEEQLSKDLADIETQRAKDGDKITERRRAEAIKIADKVLSDLQKKVLADYGLESFIADGDLSDFIKDKIKATLPLFKSISTATLSELLKIKEVLGDLEFPQELADDFEEAGGDLAKLIEMIKEAIESGDEAVDERIIDKLIKGIDKMVGSLGELASALEDTSDSFLSSIGRFMSGIASGLRDITELTKLGDKATFADKMSAGLSGLATIVSTVSSHIKANAEAQKEWNDALMESEQRMRMFRIEQEAYKDGIFGMGSPIAPAVAGVKQYMAAMEELSKVTGELGEGLVQVGNQKVPSDSAFAGFVMGGAGIGAAVGSIIPGLGTAIGAVVGGLFGGVVAGISSLFGSKASTKLVPVFKKLKDQYAWLYNEGFELNPQIRLDYERLDDATKAIVDNWEEIQAKAKEAQEQIEETLANIAGSIGEDLYSALIEAFDNKDLDSAMNKFRNSVNKILSDLAGRMLFNAIFGDILDQGEERMKNSLGADGDQNLIDDIDWIGDSLEGNIPAYLSGLESLSDMLSGLGRTLGFSDEDTETNLKGISKGVSTITEDTALVLGGYLNSIRHRLFEYMDFMMLPENRPAMAQLMQSQIEAITYLQRIDINTKVTADTNTNMLDNINKMMVSSPDGWRLRVDA